MANIRIDPEKMKSWGGIIFAACLGLFAVWAFVYDSRAADERHDTAIASVVEDVSGIVQLLKQQLADTTLRETRVREKEERAQARRELMSELCEDEDFAAKHDLECYMANIPG